ncbi:MAG: class I SAM-dependent methyltransferase [Methanoregula sp.]|nr:class I SAM-dependent methyltransferase [Methanoregula sp.]
MTALSNYPIPMEITMQISSLSKIIKKPALYEKGTAEMWCDDHISRHILEMHINPDSDSASRKRSTIEKTVRWIDAIAGPGRKTILDLGCGPGLYCELLAGRGHAVTGVDFSRRSIDYAEKSAQQNNLEIAYLRKNYLDLSFENVFDVVTMIYCDFDVLVPADRARLLKNICQALKPGGRFIFDTLNPKAPTAMKVPDRSWEAAGEGFWKDRPYLALSETFHYEEEHVILQQHIICSDQGPPSVYRFWTHYYDRESLSSILGEAGFTVESVKDDLLPDDGSGTHEMVSFCVVRKE